MPGWRQRPADRNSRGGRRQRSGSRTSGSVQQGSMRSAPPGYGAAASVRTGTPHRTLFVPLVGLEQQLQRRPALDREVPPVRQQGVPLPLDEAPVLTREAGGFPPGGAVHW